jgi:NTP pyrophosphatase (non-canonical NTP hydrolase)
MSTLSLKDHPTLADFQAYMKQANEERGFADETLPEIFMLFLEECGEMAKAARKKAQIKAGKHSDDFHLEEEIADVFIYLLEICNLTGIDLEQAFRKKEEINKKRSWQ